MRKLLKKSIEYLKSVGAERAKLLKAELNIQTYEDLLFFFPFRYVDRTAFYKINQIGKEAAEIQVIGKIVSLQEHNQGRTKRLSAVLKDETGSIQLNWFRYNKWFKDKIPLDKTVCLFGKVGYYNNSPNMSHPEIELVENTKKLTNIGLNPVYPSTELLQKFNISQRVIKKLIKELLLEIEDELANETLSGWIIENHNLISRKEALTQIHFPKNLKALDKAQHRIKFEELFFLQLTLLLKKSNRKRHIVGYSFEKVGDYFNQFFRDFLTFEFTEAQKKVIKEIRSDLSLPVQMNRLLQGDVGSGKTIVGFMCMLLARDNGYQSCLMAPTEILATQHYQEISENAAKLNLKTSLLTGSIKGKEREQLLEDLKTGNIDFLIGTHALIENKVQFKKLGLAIIDEQHKFGVAQRAKLHNKGEIAPHILVMTATPIPRTLAMSLYGDLDFSVIDELPKGRKAIKTIHKRDSHRLAVFGFMRKEIEAGRQVYVVYPLIEESKTLDYKDLMVGFETLSIEFPLPKYAISIVHGRMSAEEKEFEMQRFIKKETQILVSTTVIEVGVNVPNANVMVIESAERFGLSQLHQLRGRVGRGVHQSYCILMSGVKISTEARKRLETMVRTNDGFEISEVDLQIRGPGDIMGTQQSGILDLKLAKIHKDQQLLNLARKTAIKLLETDSELVAKENENLVAFFKFKYIKQISWSKIS